LAGRRLVLPRFLSQGLAYDTPIPGWFRRFTGRLLIYGTLMRLTCTGMHILQGRTTIPSAAHAGRGALYLKGEGSSPGVRGGILWKRGPDATYGRSKRSRFPTGPAQVYALRDSGRPCGSFVRMFARVMVRECSRPIGPAVCVTTGRGGNRAGGRTPAQRAGMEGGMGVYKRGVPNLSPRRPMHLRRGG
jgi:hypothetical protein